MKQLVCEMCGSTDIVKQAGVFVCQACGCKYSVEEAKKMMIEGTVEVTGTVKVDNSNIVKNYLDLAKNALDAKNKEEAEKYCNMVIEYEQNNYEAWFIKGQVVGWSSTLASNRMTETVNAFINAIVYCPEDKKESLSSSCKKTLEDLFSALVLTRLSSFKKWPDEEILNKLKNDLHFILDNAKKFLEKTNIGFEKLGTRLAFIMKGELSQTWEQAYSRYEDDHNSHPSEQAFDALLKEGRNIVEAYQTALLIIGEDANKLSSLKMMQYITRRMAALSKSEPFLEETPYSDVTTNNIMIAIYQKMIDCQEKMRDGCFYSSDFHKYTLTEKAIAARDLIISTYKSNIETIKCENRKIYWKEHPEEKAALEAKLSEAKSKLNDAEANLLATQKENEELFKKLKEERGTAVPSEDSKHACETKIIQLEQEYGGLGAFKGKERKALLEKIAYEKNLLTQLNDQIQKEREELNSRIDQEVSKAQAKLKPIAQQIAVLKKQIEDYQKKLDGKD